MRRCQLPGVSSGSRFVGTKKESNHSSLPRSRWLAIDCDRRSGDRVEVVELGFSFRYVRGSMALGQMGANAKMELHSGQ